MTFGSTSSYYDIIIEAVQNSRHPGLPEKGEFKPTGVIALLTMDSDPSLLFVQKANGKNYPWSNQMAFPGGHADLMDTSLEETALRELEEEMGISKNHVDTIGSIGHFQTINNRDIKAFVGFWDQNQKIKYDPLEIARSFLIPVNHLISIHMEKNFTGRIPDIHELTYPYEDVVIWGATAKILHHFLEILIPLLEGQKMMDS